MYKSFTTWLWSRTDQNEKITLMWYTSMKKSYDPWQCQGRRFMSSYSLGYQWENPLSRYFVIDIYHVVISVWIKLLSFLHHLQVVYNTSPQSQNFLFIPWMIKFQKYGWHKETLISLSWDLSSQQTSYHQHKLFIYKLSLMHFIFCAKNLVDYPHWSNYMLPV